VHRLCEIPSPSVRATYAVAPDRGQGWASYRKCPDDCSKRLTRGGLIPAPWANIGPGSPNGRQSSLTETGLAIDVPTAPRENTPLLPLLSGRAANVRNFVQCHKIGQFAQMARSGRERTPPPCHSGLSLRSPGLTGGCAGQRGPNSFDLAESCQAAESKIFLFTGILICGIEHPARATMRDVSRSSRNVVRVAMGRCGVSAVQTAQTKRWQRPVKSCGPGAATLALRWRKSFRRQRGQERPLPRGERV